MTDLDRKIAELNGWRYSPFGEEKERNSSTGQVFPMSEGFVYVQGESTYHVAGWACNWSTDTAKAFELVDEVETLGLYLQLKRIPPLKAPGMPYFEAEFANLSSILNWARDDARCYRGVADKAPEAICRAYIALKEWEKKR